MCRSGVPKLSGVAAVLLICGCVLSCDESTPAELVVVSLSNLETFSYPTVGGDEEGATIVTQPQHAAISEIRRGAETNWVATYFYQSVADYIGSDSVRLEIHTNPDGVGPPDIRQLRIQFDIRE